MARRNRQDLGWMAGGFAAAVLSCGFAVYAVARSDQPPTISGNEHLLIFTRPTTVSASPSFVRERIEALALDPIGGDPLVTGSIGTKPSAKGQPNRRIETHTLLQIFGDRALLQGPDGLVLASKGTKLGPAGIVSDIALQNGLWTVSTSVGVIIASP